MFETFDDVKATLDGMTDREQGFYEGLFQAFAFRNGEHDDGVSRHRLSPEMGWLDRDKGTWVDFGIEKFIATWLDMDDEGGIFYAEPIHATDPEYGYPVFIMTLYCTEARNARSDEWPEFNGWRGANDVIREYAVYLERIAEWGKRGMA